MHHGSPAADGDCLTIGALLEEHKPAVSQATDDGKQPFSIFGGRGGFIRTKISISRASAFRISTRCWPAVKRPDNRVGINRNADIFCNRTNAAGKERPCRSSRVFAQGKAFGDRKASDQCVMLMHHADSGLQGGPRVGSTVGCALIAAVPASGRVIPAPC